MFQDLINEEALEAGPYTSRGVATYISELGRADRISSGINIFCRDGPVLLRGHEGSGSASKYFEKVISLTVALEVCRFDMVFENVGMEPSGDAFNSLIKLEGSTAIHTIR